MLPNQSKTLFLADGMPCKLEELTEQYDLNGEWLAIEQLGLGFMATDDPLKRAFGERLLLVAQALYAIQKVDEGDWLAAEKQDIVAIQAVLSNGASIYAKSDAQDPH